MEKNKKLIWMIAIAVIVAAVIGIWLVLQNYSGSTGTGALRLNQLSQNRPWMAKPISVSPRR